MKTERLKLHLCQDRSATAVDQVGKQRNVETTAYLLHLLNALRRFNEQNVCAGFCECFSAAERLVETECGACVRPREDQEIRRRAGLDCDLDFSNCLFDWNDPPDGRMTTLLCLNSLEPCFRHEGIKPLVLS